MVRIKRRTQRVELRMTPMEKERWSTRAAAVGLDLSQYIRCCVERRQITTRMQPEVNRKTAVELGRIGVNLNQQIRAMNTALASGQFIPNVEESLAVVEEVYKAVKELQRELLDSDDRKNSKR